MGLRFGTFREFFELLTLCVCSFFSILPFSDNNGPFAPNLIDSKWESMAFAPALDGKSWPNRTTDKERKASSLVE